MTMGTRKDRERQEDLWVAYSDMAVGPGHPFYVRLNEVLDGEGFDPFVEKACARFYAESASLVGYLVEQYGSERFTRFCRQLRDGKSIEDAIKFAYAGQFQSLAELQAGWEQFLRGDKT